MESLHEQGRSAVLEGRVRLDAPPADGDRRWGISVLLRPQPELAARLHAETDQLMALAGPGQWATGAQDTAHLTLYSLEPHRCGVDPDDPAIIGYLDAMRRAAASTPPASFAVTGLGLAPGGVIAACRPLDEGARLLRPTLTEALGGEVFEGAYRGDQWWMSLVHFAEPVAWPEALVEHVQARRYVPLGTLRATRLELVRYEFDGRRMVPVTLAGVALAGGPGSPEGVGRGPHS